VLAAVGGYTGGGYYQAPQEYLDARQEPVGWTAPGFDDEGWEPWLSCR
jgi:alpha-L-rhamnosidase